MESASKARSDVILLDLEDSVQPFSEKGAARETLRRGFDAGLFDGQTVFIRVNDFDSGLLLDDLESTFEVLRISAGFDRGE